MRTDRGAVRTYRNTIARDRTTASTQMKHGRVDDEDDPMSFLQREVTSHASVMSESGPVSASVISDAQRVDSQTTEQSPSQPIDNDAEVLAVSQSVPSEVADVAGDVPERLSQDDETSLE